MHARGLVAAALLIGALTPRLGWSQDEAEAPECATVCAEAETQCLADATKAGEQCTAIVNAPCERWCPCTHLHGAAYFHCTQICEKCRADTVAPLHECAATQQAAESKCRATTGQCERDCGS